MPDSPYLRSARIVNWASYNKSLESRGSVAIQGLRLASGRWRSARDTGEKGRPQVYSDAYLEAILVLMTALRLPLRQTRGLVFRVASNSRVPSIATLCRHRQQRGVESRVLRSAAVFRDAWNRAMASGRKLTVLVDSTGISIRGVGTWRSDKPGSTERPKRTYWKLHTMVEPISGQIIAADLETNPYVSDASVLPRLLSGIPPGTVHSLAADGAYDTHGVHAALDAAGVHRSLVKPREGARRWRTSVPGASLRNSLLNLSTRNKALITGGAAWKRETGYSVRSLVETSYSRLAAMGGNKPRSRSPTGRAGEVSTSITLLNLYAAMGLPERQRRHWKPTAPA